MRNQLVETKIYKYYINGRFSAIGYCKLIVGDKNSFVINLSNNFLGESFWLENRSHTCIIEECHKDPEFMVVTKSVSNIVNMHSLNTDNPEICYIYSDPLFIGTYDECQDYCMKSNNTTLLIKVRKDYNNKFVTIDYFKNLKSGDELYIDSSSKPLVILVDFDNDGKVYIHTSDKNIYVYAPNYLNCINNIRMYSIFPSYVKE